MARPGAPSALKAFILSAWPDLSGNRVNGLLHRGQVKLRGEVTTQFDAPVNEGDAVAINFTRPYTVLRHPRLQLVYEDAYVVVVNKGYGLLSVSRGAAKPETTAYNIVKNYLKECDSRQKVFIVHRLDRDTSGLMMFAKTPEAKEAMQHNWNNMVLERKYVAVVEGNVENDEGVIRSYLGETSAHEVFSTQDPQQGKLAVTRYKVLARGQGRSLVEYSLDTGRKNQTLLIQPQYQPWPVENEVAVIYCGVNGLLEKVPVEKVPEFESLFIQLLKSKYQKEVLDVLKSGKLTDECQQLLRQCAAEIASRYNA